MINQAIYKNKPIPQVQFGGPDDFGELLRASYIQHCGFWEAVIHNQEDVVLGQGQNAHDFRDFLMQYAADDELKHPILVKYGTNDRNGTPLRFSFKYLLISFDDGEAGSSIPMMINQPGTQPMSGFGMHPQAMSGLVTQDQLQGIIDKNVSDVQRSLRAEFDEQNARNNADSYKQKIEYEIRLLEFQLEMKRDELDKKEAEIEKKLIDYEDKQRDTLGSVRDYTKAIAGGLMELGKGYLGIKNSGLSGVDDKPENPTKQVIEDDKGDFAAKEEAPETPESEEESDYTNLSDLADSFSDEEAAELLAELQKRKATEPEPDPVQESPPEPPEEPTSSGDNEPPEHEE
jgi:hypothetical protein